MLITQLKILETVYTLVNIYSPTKGNEKDQTEFFIKIIKSIEDFDKTFIIIGGDFNIYKEDIDKSNKYTKN